MLVSAGVEHEITLKTAFARFARVLVILQTISEGNCSTRSLSGAAACETLTCVEMMGLKPKGPVSRHLHSIASHEALRLALGAWPSS